MAHGIEQVLFRSAMGIMAGYARFRLRLDSLMGVEKACCFLVVALNAKRAD